MTIAAILTEFAGAGYCSAVSCDNVELVRRCYEVINSIGRSGSKVLDPEEVAPDLWERLDPDFELHDRPDLPVGRGSDLRIEADETDVFWLREGRIARLQGFATREEALAAAELAG
jgi:hypothetical protein